MYKVVFTKKSVKQLKEINNPFRENILNSIIKLGEDPYVKSNVKKLVSYYDIYRLRVGDFRIKFLINEIEKIIEIIAISHRKNAY